MKAILCSIVALFICVNKNEPTYSLSDVQTLKQIVLDNVSVNGTEDNALSKLGWTSPNIIHWKNIIWTSTIPKRVEGLNLSSMQLERVDLRGLFALKQVDLSNNHLQQVLLPPFPTMIDLSHNSLKQIDIHDLYLLSSLDISYNHLDEIILPQKSHLQLLDVSFNFLSSLNMSNQSKLETFMFASNRLTELDLSSCYEITSIKGRNNLLNKVIMPKMLKHSFPSIELMNDIDGCENEFPLLEVSEYHSKEVNQLTYIENAKETVEQINKILGPEYTSKSRKDKVFHF
ncbi:hypothetical protein K4L44_17160 [Halosquirtibacter laminarini]|uniref:Uncharacterized protein n=1 Tax=Halosquirtibacter laminarini TaxID=3374600 RepID=A0AC61NPF6_9BACT|nr:hypothetical protein K4L44_17160 [Prolixibacteraceae bacterium]